MGRRALVLVVALLLAAIAAFAIFQYLSGVRDEVLEGQQAISVFRAVGDIGEGTAGDLILSQTNRFKDSTEEQEDLPGGAITTPEELNAVLRGKVAAGPITDNQVLISSQWVQITVDIIPLADIIPSGKQAITISTDAIRGVNGFVEPGDRINVIVTLEVQFDPTLIPGTIPGLQPETPTGEEPKEAVRITRFVLQGLNVLAVGTDIRPEAGEETPVVVSTTIPGQEGQAAPQAPQTVFTIEVTPEQAERLVFTFENGSTWLTLVPEDFVEVDTKGITIDTLFESDLVEDIFGQ